MPQTSLLSYLSKPRPVSPVPAPSDNLAERPPASPVEPTSDSSKSTMQSTSLGIVERVQDHVSTEGAPIPVPHIPDALIVRIAQYHLPAIQRLTSTTLPVRYGNTFFQSTVTDYTAAQLSRTVLYSSEPVGWIRCRLEPCAPGSSSGPDLQQIYIQALALLAPYRGHGLASILLDTIEKSSIATSNNTVCIYAHVWEKNVDALEWYAKRGFKRVILLERYYRRLNPGGAWIVRKELS